VLPSELSRRAAADATGLWISSPDRREVLRIDARTRRVSRFPVAGDAGPLAIVGGRIWVGTLHDDDPLARITVLEPDGRIVTTMPLPSPAVNIAPAPGGGAWVSFGADSTVRPAAVRVGEP
jgi:hypothetical protein